MAKFLLLILVLFVVRYFGKGNAQECVSGLLDAERVRQLGRVAGNRKNDRDKLERIIPAIQFTCSGQLTRWIVAAEWKSRGRNLPELQIWRGNNTSGVFTKIAGSVISDSSEVSSGSNTYEHLDSVEFQEGDVLGIFEPKDSRMKIYYTDKYGPTNYDRDTGDAETSPVDSFNIFHEVIRNDKHDMPLVSVDVVPTDGSPAADCVMNFATMESISIGLQQVGESKPIRDEDKEQRLIPDITFTCSGFITKWIIAAKGGNKNNLPELQTWQLSEVNTYTKNGSPTTFDVPGESGEVVVYEYSPNPPHEFHNGDVLGIFVPKDSRFKLFYFATPSGPVNYVRDTGDQVHPPQGAFIIDSRDREDAVNALPLVAVEVSIPQSPMFTTTMETSTVSTFLPQTSRVTMPSPSLAQESQVSIASTLTSLITSVPSVSVATAPSDSGLMEPTQTKSLTPSVVHQDTETTPIMEQTPSTSIATSSTSLAEEAMGSSIELEPQPTPIPTPKLNDSSSSSSQAGLLLSVVIAIVAVLLLAGIVGVAITVVVVRRRMNHYDMARPVISPGLTNPVYGGAPVTQGKAVVDDRIYHTLEASVYEDLQPSGYGMPFTEQRIQFIDNQVIYNELERYASEDCYFAESEIYWVPASNESELYAQLARNRFREIPRPLIRVGDRLGSGNFGQVNKGFWESPKGSVEVAVKTLHPKASEDRVKFLQEAAIMGQFNHPNVVTLHGVVTIDEPMMIILEFVPNGDLRHYLIKLRPDPGERLPPSASQMCLDFSRQIAVGMNYLSGKAFIHRDLAARNILVAKDATCKIADFGMARDLDEEDYYFSQGGQVPVKWTAPEALNFKKYSTASDVWSYGILLYEIWSLGHKPFEGYNNMQVTSLVDSEWRLPPPPGCPRDIYRLMIHCWHPEAQSRPTFSELLESTSQPEAELLRWSKEDRNVHPLATELGGPLDAGRDLYVDLQETYKHKIL